MESIASNSQKKIQAVMQFIINFIGDRKQAACIVGFGNNTSQRGHYALTLSPTQIHYLAKRQTGNISLNYNHISATLTENNRPSNAMNTLIAKLAHAIVDLKTNTAKVFWIDPKDVK